MEIRSYNQELSYANLLFLRLFNNIVITRQLANGKSQDIKVKCVLGQRSRILKNLENPDKKGTYKIPMIAINRTGYSRNSERLNNLHNEITQQVYKNKINYNLLTPIPIDITYDVIVISKYPADIDMIASNFMVFFNNDLYVSQEHPKYHGIIMNNQVVMQDSVNEEHSDELDETTEDFITSTFQFTFKTYLFGGTDKRYVTSVISSDQCGNDIIYDGYVPLINSLSIGVYAIPTVSTDFI